MNPDLATFISLIAAPILLLVSTTLLAALPPPFPLERKLAIFASLMPFLWTSGTIFFPGTIEWLVDYTLIGPLIILIFVLITPPALILVSLAMAIVKRRWKTVVTFATSLSLLAVTALTYVLAWSIYDGFGLD